MISTIYVSRASRPLSLEDLGLIVETSRRHNERLGLTGMLLYRDGRFLQVIEGDDHTVADRLEVIFRDLRHITPRVLLSDPIDTRQFPRWSMGFPPAESAVLASSAGYRYAFGDEDVTVTRQANAPALRALTRWFEDHRHPSE